MIVLVTQDLVGTITTEAFAVNRDQAYRRQRRFGWWLLSRFLSRLVWWRGFYFRLIFRRVFLILSTSVSRVIFYFSQIRPDKPSKCPLPPTATRSLRATSDGSSASPHEQWKRCVYFHVQCLSLLFVWFYSALWLPAERGMGAGKIRLEPYYRWCSICCHMCHWRVDNRILNTEMTMIHCGLTQCYLYLTYLFIIKSMAYRTIEEWRAEFYRYKWPYIFGSFFFVIVVHIGFKFTAEFNDSKLLFSAITTTTELATVEMTEWRSVIK